MIQNFFLRDYYKIESWLLLVPEILQEISYFGIYFEIKRVIPFPLHK